MVQNEPTIIIPPEDLKEIHKDYDWAKRFYEKLSDVVFTGDNYLSYSREVLELVQESGGMDRLKGQYREEEKYRKIVEENREETKKLHM